jgi:hypothetical protein
MAPLPTNTLISCNKRKNQHSLLMETFCMNEVDQYLERCHQYPAGRIKFCHFRAVFLMALTPAHQKLWPRKRLLAEMAARFQVGRHSAGVLHIGGLSLFPEPKFVAEGGRLRLHS